MIPDTEKGIELYVDADFSSGWNQEEGKYPRSIVFRTGYVTSYYNYPIIWSSQTQTWIELIETEAECIDLYQTMRDIWPFVSLIQ